MEQRPAAKQPAAVTTLMMMLLPPQPQLQQAAGRGSMWHMQMSSQTQMAAAAMASQWLPNYRLA